VAPGRGVLRLARAAFFAVSAVGLAAAAHLAGGEGVPVRSLLIAVPAVMLVVHLLAAGRRGPAGLLIGMGLTQAVLHVAFMTSSVAADCWSTASAPMTGMPMGDHGHAVLRCDPVMAEQAAGLWPSGSMLLAHALATVVVVLLLAHGEAALWALAAGLSFRFRLPVATVLPPVVRPRPVAVAAFRRAPQAVHLRTVRRRGPPALAGAVP
jgi:hypothetical protein